MSSVCVQIALVLAIRAVILERLLERKWKYSCMVELILRASSAPFVGHFVIVDDAYQVCCMLESCLRALQEVTQDTFKSGKGVKVGMDSAAATSCLTCSSLHCCMQHMRVMVLRVGEHVYAQGITGSLSFVSKRGGGMHPQKHKALQVT